MRASNKDNLDTGHQSLKISVSRDQLMSKEQSEYNRLIAKIEKLETKIKDENQKYDNILKYYIENYLDAQNSLAGTAMEFAFDLDKKHRELKLSPAIEKQLKSIIIYLIETALQEREPNEKEIELMDAWSDISYHQQREELNSYGKVIVEEMFGDMFGEELDVSDLDINDPESIAEFRARFQEKIKDTEFFDNEERRSKRKKTARQLQKEERLKAEEDIKNKSLRSVYISLSKVLHPDLENEPDKKKEKEDALKLVTIAYKNKDLPALLRFEMQWIYQTSKHLDQLTDDKLKIYNNILKEKLREINDELSNLPYHPKYESIWEFMTYNEKKAIEKIKKRSKTTAGIDCEIKIKRLALTHLNRKMDLYDFVKKLHIEWYPFFDHGYES